MIHQANSVKRTKNQRVFWGEIELNTDTLFEIQWALSAKASSPLATTWEVKSIYL